MAGSVSTAWIGVVSAPRSGPVVTAAPAPAPTPTTSSAPVQTAFPVSYSQSQGALAMQNPFAVDVSQAMPVPQGSSEVVAPSAVTPGGPGGVVTISTAQGAPIIAPSSGEPDIGEILLYGVLALLVLHALK